MTAGTQGGDVSDGLQQAFALLLGSVGTCLVIIVSYYYGPGGYLRKKHHLPDDDEKE